MTEFQKLVRKLRESTGLSQEDFAKSIKVSLSTVSFVESGRSKMMQITNLHKYRLRFPYYSKILTQHYTEYREERKRKAKERYK